MWIKWIIFLIGVLFCRYCANMDNLVRYWKELSRTIQIAGIGSKACRRRNRVPSRSFSTLNQAEISYPVKSDRLLIKNATTVTWSWPRPTRPRTAKMLQCKLFKVVSFGSEDIKWTPLRVGGWIVNPLLPLPADNVISCVTCQFVNMAAKEISRKGRKSRSWILWNLAWMHCTVQN